MCWISKNLTQQISDGNVKIFKMCMTKNYKLCGYFYTNFEYILDEEYQTEINIGHNVELNRFVGNQGFHSYDATKCEVKKIIDREVKLCVTRCAFKPYTVVKYLADAVLVEGYLPKGTTYYVNADGEIISDKIILTEITKI